MNFDLGLLGRQALVTGGTKGVGAAVVAAFRDAGGRGITTARTAPERLMEGGRFVAADVSTSSGCAAVANEVKSGAGGASSSTSLGVRAAQPVVSRPSTMVSGRRR